MSGQTTTNPSLASFMLPGGISKIKCNQRGNEDNASFLEDLEQIETTMARNPDSFYDSRSTIQRGRMDSASTDRRMTRRIKRSKQRRSMKKKRKADPLDMLKWGKGGPKSSQLEGFGDLRKFMQGYGNSQIMEMESETESDVEDGRERSGHRRVKKIVFKNDIGKIDQKINVSNFNCSCRVF